MNRDGLLAWLRARAAAIAAISEDAVDVDLPLSAFGADSAATAAIAADLEPLAGGPVEVAVLFQHGSLASLADALAGSRPAAAAPPLRAPEAAAPVAAVGLACRVPGASGPPELWDLLISGRDAVTEVPAGRWPPVADLGAARYGGFLDDVAGFDADFFRIPHEEAARMDPQHRLLLEVVWECLEDAGLPPEAIRGSATGVFIGISANEYGRRQVTDAAGVSALTPSGSALAIAANRVSYTYDLRGPSIAVDTACSSSLVALHLAVRSLRSGECERAIVGGVNLLLEPEISVALRQAGMLSPDGRCKAFDASANGYVRAEGCVAILLEAPGSRPRRAYALIRGSAVNQDGRTNGLTAPSGAAQERVLSAAYRDAGIEPATVEYVECHGTGTYLGDPIEARSLARVVGAGQRDGRCAIGSVKTNIGHLEAAAGLAGVAKVMLALDRGMIPPTLHVRTPNPQADFGGIALEIAGEARPWTAAGSARVAGVSSFGFGGTNAHAVLSGPAAPAASGAAASGAAASGAAGLSQGQGPYLVPVSARSEEARSDAAARLAELVRGGDADIAAIAAAAATARSHLPFRTAVVAGDAAGIAAALDAAVPRRPRRPRREPPRVGFVFTGQGSQHPAMAARLGERFPVFASTIARCDEAIADLCGWRLREVLDGGAGGRLDLTEVAQPALLAVAAGLLAVWRSLGVTPAAVAGHSAGELAAAYAANVLTLEQAVRLAVRRGEAMADTRDLGGMLVLGATAAEAGAVAAELGCGVAVAAVNGPQTCVLSGDPGPLAAIEARWAADGRFARRLPSRYPFHGPRMAAAAARFEAAVAGEALRAPAVPMLSSVTGARIGPEAADAALWRRNVSDPVLFADAIGAMLDEPVDVLLEIGPHPDLGAAARQVAAAAGRDVPVLASLRRDTDGDAALLQAAGILYEEGASLTWRRLTPAAVPAARLPAYPWQHRRHWIDRPAARTAPPAASGLLGTRVDLAGDDDARWDAEPALAAPYLADHLVGGVPVFPAAGYVELMVAAGRGAGMSGPIVLEDVRIHAFLPLGDGGRVQTRVARSDGAARVTVHGRGAEAVGWTLYAEARIDAAEGTGRTESLLTAQVEYLDQIPLPLFYARLRERGLGYGPAFRALDDIWRGETGAIARVRPAAAGLAVDPRTLDGALQLLAATGAADDGQLYVPAGFDRIAVYGAPPDGARALARVRDATSADACIVGPDERVLVDIAGIRLSRVEAGHAAAAQVTWEYDVAWRPGPAIAEATLQGRRILVLSDGPGTVGELAGALEAGGADVVTADGNDAADVLLRRIRAADSRADTIVFACALGGPAEEDRTPQWSAELSARLASLLQAVSFGSAAGMPDVWVITRGVHVLDGETTPAGCRLAAPLWGLVKAVPFENPSLRCRAVDLGDASDPRVLRRLAAEIAAASDEAEVALRPDARLVRRLTAVPPPAPRAPGRVADPGAMYIVTGGHGALGSTVARWLAARGARHLALLGRHAAESSDLVAELRSAGAEVLSLACDVTSPDQVAAAIDRARKAGPIRGIVHAAGIRDDGPLLRMTGRSLADVIGPKAGGAWWIARQTAGDDLDWVVYFSSAASVLGSPGQANYCAANAFLDAFARDAARSVPRAVVVNWGPWAGDGMAADSAAMAGFAKLAPDDAVAALERLLGGDGVQRVVLPIDLRNLVQFYPVATGLPFFADIDADLELHRSIGAASALTPRPALDHEPVAPRNPTEEQIAGIWQASLGIDQVGVLDGFFELGGDSVFGNQIIVAINRALGVSIDVERAFRDFTVARLAELAEEALLERLQGMTDEEAEAMLSEARRHDG